MWEDKECIGNKWVNLRNLAYKYCNQDRICRGTSEMFVCISVANVNKRLLALIGNTIKSSSWIGLSMSWQHQLSLLTKVLSQMVASSMKLYKSMNQLIYHSVNQKNWLISQSINPSITQ